MQRKSGGKHNVKKKKIPDNYADSALIKRCYNLDIQVLSNCIKVG